MLGVLIEKSGVDDIQSFWNGDCYENENWKKEDYDSYHQNSVDSF